MFVVCLHRENIREDEIPSDLRTMSEDFRQELIEHVSNVDDALGEMFLGKRVIFISQLHIDCKSTFT